MSSAESGLIPASQRAKKISVVSNVSRTDSEAGCVDESTRLQQEEDDGGGGGPGDDEYCDYHDLPPPPDGGYGWVIVFASFMCNLIVDGIAYTFGVFLGEMVEYFDESKGKTAWVGSLLSGMYLSAGPLVSALTNKFGCRAVCISGSLIATFAFVCSIFSPTVNWLMLTYGFIGGLGFGLIYLPAVVCVGYYFETKRSLATGIAVCGSGVGTFAFAPFAAFLLERYDWRGANLILAGLILNCVLFGALMRPLEYPKEGGKKPLLLRMAEERRIQMERGSLGGSYFMVQLPDGTMERRQKQPLNIDPGVHSSLNLDQLAPGTPITPIPTVPTLPTITEAKVPDMSGSGTDSGSGSPSPKASATELKPQAPQVQALLKPGPRTRRDSDNSIPHHQNVQKLMPRNASQPAFSSHHQGLPKNGSVPTFDRIRKTSFGERFKPTLNRIRSTSRPQLPPNASNGSFIASQADVESLAGSTLTTTTKRSMVRPMSRKDIFYSGSVCNLKEFEKSQKDLTSYRQSILSLRSPDDQDLGGTPGDICPCLVLPESFTSALSQMLDTSLLKEPAFLAVAVSNLFGMAGLYVPFVYLVDFAQVKGLDSSSASFLISIIGMTNTVGRVACGYFADFPKVDALLVNNCCLLVASVAVGLTPVCATYQHYVIMAVCFGVAISGYISLTSIILVDLLGLDKLTNAFGLLILFRGAAAIVGSPLAGAIYDSTHSYDIPFYVAGAFFLVSALTSFMAPVLKRCTSKEEAGAGEDGDDDQLAPIDEDDEEDEPITMGQGAGSGRHQQHQVPNADTDEQEIQQKESVL